MKRVSYRKCDGGCAVAEAVGAWSARGVQCFTVGIDSAFLAQRAGAFLGAVKGSST